MIDEVGGELRRLKMTAERALDQVQDADFFATLDAEANSLAVLVKHVGGNLRSRWTDFLTTDGEKPDRDRDGEFIVAAADTRAALMQRWEDGWKAWFDTLASLKPDDLARTVTIRGEKLTASAAIARGFSHTAAHVGQIVMLAKHHAGARWKTLTIPRGQSASYRP